MADGGDKVSILSHIFSHAMGVPSISKLVLVLGAVLVGSGLTSKMVNSTPSPQQEVSKAPGAQVVETPSQPDAPGTGTPKSDWLTRVGMGFVGGFGIGWLFRAFIKMMATVTLIGGLLFTGISYFGGKNIDLSAAKQKYDGAISWVTEQVGKAKDAAVEHMPNSGGAGVIGSIFGFRRKKTEA